ncbi:MAG: hypothetical protein ABFD57_07180 [Smithella sp.]|nr:hypothetical protein [Syntrophaceae bacterium]NTW76315.1 hypothetical protein [Syntrophaceae bacterium]
MQEFLVVAAIVLVLFFLPRFMGRKAEPAPQQDSPGIITTLTGWMRLAILVTIFWIAGLAVYLKPWESCSMLFIYVALSPVAVGWGAFWVWSGYKKYHR